jgi:Lrp/AsnC family transcriptional regulator
MGNARSVKLDSFDQKILSKLQSDATLPLEVLAEQVGLSASPCWRRIRRLEDAGFISRRVAILNRKKLNVGVTVFIAIRTNQHTVEWLSSFKNAVQNIPEIVDFYRMSGTIDYLLKAYLPDIESYDALYQKLISRVQLSDVTSMFAMEEIKSTTEIPLNFCDGQQP